MKRKKALLGLLAIPLALLLSGCFLLQGFRINANVIKAGGKATKAVFEIRPARSGTNDTAHQFFLIGVDDTDLRAGKARWGTNGTFGGPYPLTPAPGLDTVIGDQCTSNGFNLADATGLTWKGYRTPSAVNDRDRSKKDVIVQIGLKALASATPGDYGVVGVTGAWVDDGDNNPESTDAYLCTGVSQVSVNVKA